MKSWWFGSEGLGTHLVVTEQAADVSSSARSGGGGGSATPVDVRCANHHIDTDTTKLACASNRVSVEDTKELFTGLGAVFVPQ